MLAEAEADEGMDIEDIVTQDVQGISGAQVAHFCVDSRW